MESRAGVRAPRAPWSAPGPRTGSGSPSPWPSRKSSRSGPTAATAHGCVNSTTTCTPGPAPWTGRMMTGSFSPPATRAVERWCFRGRRQGNLAPAEGETDFHHVYVLPGDRGFLFHPHVDLGFNSIDIFTGTERRELLHMEGQSLNRRHLQSGPHRVHPGSPTIPGSGPSPFHWRPSMSPGTPSS